MADIVERLRDPATVKSWQEADAQRNEAADEIERLRHDLDRHVQIATEQTNEVERRIKQYQSTALDYLSLDMQAMELMRENAELRGLLQEAHHDVTTCYFNAIDSREALMCDHYSDLLARIDAALAQNKMFAEELNDRVKKMGSLLRFSEDEK